MGQHKTNPTAIAAKQGELPPKEKKLSAAERRKLIKAEIQHLIDKAGIDPNDPRIKNVIDN